MEEKGVGRFHGKLDPRASEFWPSYSMEAGLAVAPPATLPPTRALLLSSVAVEASESSVRRDLEVFGDVRAVEMGRIRDGIVGVHFYDLRAAHAALEHIRLQHMQHQHRLRLYYTQFAGAPPPPPPSHGLVSGRVVWAQFVLPPSNAFPDSHNQGTLVVFNLHSHISASVLVQIFSSFGPIREVRDTPMKSHQKFVEFYDVRDAGAAIAEMNGKEIGGKQVTIEFSRPGGRRPFAPPPPRFSLAPPPSRNTSKKSARNLQCSSQSPPAVVGDLRFNTKSKPCPSQSPREAKISSKPWKGKHHKSFDPRFLIKEDTVVDPDCKDTPRTTVMIKNIPNKYSQKLVLNMLDNHCIHYNEQKKEPMSSYDFLYLPIDFNNKCNVGYGFVNMTSAEAALRLYKAFHQQHWEVFNSRKICEVTYARVQGLEALKEHFKNSKFACETEEYMPVIFSPPRDGRAHLSDPLPIVPFSSTAGDDSHHDFDVEG